MGYKDKLGMLKERYLGKEEERGLEEESEPEVSIEEPEADISEDIGVGDREREEEEEEEPSSVYTAQYETESDRFTDSKDEIERALSDFKSTLSEPEVTLSQGERVDPVRDSESYDDGSEMTKEGKKFGFIRSKIDDIKDTLKLKTDAKKAAYEEYLKAKPKVLQEKYERGFQEKLRIEGMTSEERAGELKTKGASGLRKVAEMLGGSVHPGKMTGMSGSVFGPLPGFLDKRERRDEYGRENYMDRFGTSGIPEKYAKPGVVGSQVPKYKSAPKSSAPGTTWSRVSKIDSQGKKRSYLRKSRIPQREGYPNQSQKIKEQQMQPRMGVPGIKGLGGFGGFEMSGFGKLIGPKEGLGPKDLSGYFGMGKKDSPGMEKEESSEDPLEKIQRYMKF